MSLVIDNELLADLVESAWLVAVTCAVVGIGRSVGAVYIPVEVIVPSVAFPPGTPFTLQLTAVSLVFVTVAVNVAWLPSTTDTLAGVTEIWIDGGGGGGGGAAAEPHPNAQAASTTSAISTNVLVLSTPSLICERDRMPSQKQPKGQRRGIRIGMGGCATVKPFDFDEPALIQQFEELQGTVLARPRCSEFDLRYSFSVHSQF